MSEWSSADVVANGVRLHYYRTGGNKPPIVMAHGFSDNGLCWTRVAQALEDQYDVIMVDARGHGLSEAPQTGYSTEDRAADLAGLIQALGLGKPPCLGHSMGASTVASAAALFPEHIGAALLEDPGWRPAAQAPSSENMQKWLARARADVEARKQKTRAELVAQAHADNPGWHEDELGPWAESKLQMSAYNLQSLGRVFAPWQDAVRQIVCPILLITADPEKGAIVSPEVAQEAASLWRQGKVVRISPAGHCIHRDQFAPYMTALKAFLAEIA
jgi:N-formylmaleamate deformylase